MYRLDISDKVFQAASQCLDGHINKEAPPFEEILASAKTWLSFYEPMIPTVASVTEPSILEDIVVPASPALSTVSMDTLVGEDCEVNIINMKMKLLEDDVKEERFYPDVRTPIPEVTVGCLDRVFGPVHPNGPPRRRRSNKNDHQQAVSGPHSIQISSTSALIHTVSPYPVSDFGYPWFENGAEYDLIIQYQ